MRKFVPALVTGILAISFSALAVAQSSGTMDKERTGANAGASSDTTVNANERSAHARTPARSGAAVSSDTTAGAGATDEPANGKKKSKAKKSSSKKSKDKSSKASSGGTAATGGAASSRESSPTSSPSQTTGAPGSANQGSVHNDEAKK